MVLSRCICIVPRNDRPARLMFAGGIPAADAMFRVKALRHGPDIRRQSRRLGERSALSFRKLSEERQRSAICPAGARLGVSTTRHRFPRAGVVASRPEGHGLRHRFVRGKSNRGGSDVMVRQTLWNQVHQSEGSRRLVSGGMRLNTRFRG